MGAINQREYGKSTGEDVVILQVFICLGILAWSTFGLWWAGYWWAGKDTTDLGKRVIAGEAPWITESTYLAVGLAVALLVLAFLVGLLIRKVRGSRTKEDAAAAHMGKPSEVAHMTLKARRKQNKRLGVRR
jgi:hypothetical protein